MNSKPKLRTAALSCEEEEERMCGYLQHETEDDLEPGDMAFIRLDTCVAHATRTCSESGQTCRSLLPHIAQEAGTVSHDYNWHKQYSVYVLGVHIRHCRKVGTCEDH